MFVKPLLVLLLIGGVSPDGGAGVAERDVDSPFHIQAAYQPDDALLVTLGDSQPGPFHQGKAVDPSDVGSGIVPEQLGVPLPELNDGEVCPQKVTCHHGRSSMNRSIGSSSEAVSAMTGWVMRSL